MRTTVDPVGEQNIEKVAERLRSIIGKMEIADKKEQLAAIGKLNPKGANVVSFCISNLQSF